MRTCSKLALTTGVLALLIGPIRAADWPGWRGSDRTGVSKETGLLKTWPMAGPKLLWQSDKAGLGYAGMAVVDGVVYTMGARGKDEYVIALDGKGDELWATKIGPVFVFEGNNFSHGPNATPSVAGDHVYALGSQGILVCVEKKKGGKAWDIDLRKNLGGQVNPIGGGGKNMGWGYSWSPLIDGGTIVILPGGPKGLFAALNKKGEVLWQSKGITEQCTYSAPIMATIGGVKQYIALTQKGLVGVSAKDGEVLWVEKREEAYPDVVCPTPIADGDLVYSSVGFGGGATCLKVTADGKNFKTETLYTNTRIGNKQGGVVRVGKYVYGFHEDYAWTCQELATGTIAWPKARPRTKLLAGGVLAADGRLYALLEVEALGQPGKVAMLDASPKTFKLISRFPLPALSKNRKPRGNVWTHPSLSDGKLYLRDQELVFCYEVK